MKKLLLAVVLLAGATPPAIANNGKGSSSFACEVEPKNANFYNSGFVHFVVICWAGGWFGR